MTNINLKSDFDPNIIKISGPVNVVRMEGNINGIKKIIYLFMDFHLELWNETECNNIFSHDINQYFAESFYKLNGSNLIYDFFLEIYPTRSYSSGSKFLPKKQKYIWEVSKLFQKVFKYDEEKNKVGLPDVFQNVRIHYIDIRDYLKEHLIDKIDIVTKNINSLNFSKLNPEKIQKIIGEFQNIKSEIDKIINLLKYTNEDIVDRTKIIKEKDPHIIDESAMRQLVYKLKYRYNHGDIKNTLNDLLENIIKKFISYTQFIEKSIEEIKQFNVTLSKSQDIRQTRKIQDRIYNIGDILLQDSITIFVGIVDIYFLRRFLDKDYITNAIVYTGILHSTTYIEILAKYFDFKITHVAQGDINIKQINNKIKNLSEDEIFDLFSRETIRPSKNKSGTPSVYQCSDITHFPENFT